MSDFKDAMKNALGDPHIDVELCDDPDKKNDYDFIMERTLRVVSEYQILEHILHKPTPSSGVDQSSYGQGNIDLSCEDPMTVSQCYVVKPRDATVDVLLPWSIVRVWEQAWIGQGKSDFLATDLYIYRNELDQLNRVSNARFDWKWYPAEKKLYVTNVPAFATGIGIVCMKRVEDLDDLNENSDVYEWALKLAVGYAKQKIGQTLRKFTVDGLDLPGQVYVDEGKEEEKDAREWIEKNSFYPGGINI